jgi:hypothetical protein
MKKMMAVLSDLQGIWKEGVVAYLYISCICPEGLRKTSVGIVGGPVEVQTGYILKNEQKQYLLRQLAQWCFFLDKEIRSCDVI